MRTTDLQMIVSWLGSGPINVIDMASGMTRDPRRSPKIGMVPPAADFGKACCDQGNCFSDRADLNGRRCRIPSKDIDRPAVLLLVSAQIRFDHINHIDES